MELKKRARIAKKSTAELIALLRKDMKMLTKKDPFKAETLSKILKEADLRLNSNQWEDALEEILEYIYKYDIPLREQTKHLCREALDHYDRPNWTFRGHDLFGFMYDELKTYYNTM